MKRITSLVLVLLLVLSSSLALAADFDLRIVETGEVRDFLDWPFDDEVYLDVVLGEEEGKYLIECEGKFYKAEEVVEASQKNPNADLSELVKDLEPVEKVPGEDLKVVGVSAIDNTTVQVVIEPLEEDLLGATIDVFDSNGNKVAVKPVDIIAGDDVVFFEFETPVSEADLKGVWTVGGVKYDFDLIAKLGAFVEADNQVKLNKALTDLGIKNVKVENMPAYFDAKEAFLDELEDELPTVEAIQAWIDEINTEQLTEAEKTKAVKAVKDAGNNEVLLLQALQEYFVRVNPDWISDYRVKLFGDTNPVITDGVTYDDIQGAINNVNNEEIKGVLNGLKDRENDKDEYTCVDKAKLLEAKALIEAYATPDDKGEQTKDTKDALKAIDIQLAIVDVRAATTPTTLKNALIRLENVAEENIMEEEEGEYAGYIDANARYYLDGYEDGYDNKVKGIKDADVKTVGEVKEVIKNVNEAVDKAQGEVNKRLKITSTSVANKVYSSTQKGDIFQLGYSVQIDVDADTDTEKSTNYTTEDTESIVIDFYKGKTLLGKLTFKGKPGEGKYVKPSSTVSGTIDVYGDYVSTSWDQEWYGKLTDIPDKVVATVEYDNGKVAVATKENPNFSDVTPFFVEAVNRAQTADEMSKALINLEAKMGEGQTAFTNLPKADKLIVAQRVLEIRNEQEGIKGIPNTAGKFFSDKNTLDASVLFNTDGVVDRVITARNSILTEVNKAVVENNDTQDGKITAIITALEAKIGTTGDDVKPFFPEFVKLTPADKADIAELVLENAPKDKDGKVIGYKTVAEIKAVAGL